MSQRDECTECGAALTKSDLREGPDFPEIGYVYYKCPECSHRMPGPPTASPKEETEPYLPGDEDWRENPRDYHDQINFQEAIYHVIDEVNNEDGATWDDVVDKAAERFALSSEETEKIVTDLLESGRCYEPGEGLLQTL